MKVVDMLEVNAIWSYVLVGGGFTASWLIGSDRPVGWFIAVVLQVAWLVFGVATHQWGFIVSAVGYGVINGRNLRLCIQRRREREVVNGG